MDAMAIGCRMIHKETTGSTNLDAVSLAEELPHGAVIWADAQSAGRGRRGRSWVSEPGMNLYFSLLLKPDFAPEQASMLTLVMALAAAKGIETVYGNGQPEIPKVGIKWPNDIVMNGRKVCGILTEMQAVPGKIKHVIIGVGINVNQLQFSQEGLAYASSLKKETGLEKDREELLKAVLRQFQDLYEEFCRAGTLAPMLEAYQSRLVNLKKEVQILDPKGAYQGVALGMNEKGELLVQKTDGTTEAVYAGEVSVRGLFGYV